MALFVLADTHLSLTTEKPMDIFGTRWKDHDKRIAENWKRIVSEKDTVVLPGDISWAMTLNDAEADLRFLNELPGQKILSKGNHDYWWQTNAKIQAFFQKNSFGTLRILYNNAYAADGFRICGTRGWYTETAAPGGVDYSKIVAREAGRLRRSLEDKSQGDGEPLVFLHFPPVFGDFVCRELLDVLKDYGVKRCFFGHLHGQYNFPKQFFFEDIQFTIVAADHLSFCPYLIK